MSKAYKELQPYLGEAMAFQTAMVLFGQDDETLALKEAGAYTSKVIGTLSGEHLEKITCDEVKYLIAECKEDRTLSEVKAAIVREVADELEKLECAPPEEYRGFAQLSAESTRIWAGARKGKDFGAFTPTFQKVIDHQKKFAPHRVKDGQRLYDTVLDTYEKGFNMEALDEFFRQLKGAIILLLKEVMKHGKKIDDNFLAGDYLVEKQEEIAKYLAEYVGSDFDKGALVVNAHPFTANPHNHDVKIAMTCSEHVGDSIFSAIREVGHGIYELGIRDELAQTAVGQGAPMSTHEPQSHFFENIIGHNRVLWAPVYRRLQELSPEQPGDINLDTFTDAINKVQPSLTRIQMDELTYSLHVTVRYEIGKMLMEGNLEVEELPDVWADKYEEYLGMHPKDMPEGVLQGIRWFQGSFGYFPSHVLGSAFGVQPYARVKEEMDFEGLLEEGKTDVIREYLKNHTHQFDKLKTSREILKDVTGEGFSSKYYVEYLTEKYRRTYEL